MIQDLWYKNAVIYSLDLETFMDSNGDGTGDFEGLTRRLDYLETLGVDVIWLAPFQPSPNRDNGYDISDYYGVDPRHGSSGDFVEFMHLAKKRGMKVIIDLVVNHTSDRHRWFQEARRSPDSPYRDWYIWSKTRPATADEGMVFPGVQTTTWTYDARAGEYYFHRFFDFQPDLNIGNPAVRTEIQRIIGYWLELGVDGFRVDAVPFIIEQPDSEDPARKPKMKFEYLEELRDFLQWRTGEAILLGEANVLPKETAHYFRGGRGIHLMFNFWVNQRLFHALAAQEVASLAKALEETRELPATAQWAQFLRNHDELDLGRLTEKQRAATFARFGPDREMQLYDRGIRRRLAPMIGNRAQLELAYSVMFSLPGTPVLRYGDEIGMGDDLELEERDAVRTPMQWDATPNGGFSTARRPVHPVIAEGPFAFEHVNVERQKRDTSSLLQWTARMIQLRKECPEIGQGTWRVLDTGSPHVLAMQYEWRGDSVVAVHNFAGKPLEITLPVASERLVDLRVESESRVNARGRHELALDAFGYRWFRVRAGLPSAKTTPVTPPARSGSRRRAAPAAARRRR
jgi:maltose alpha-D-glucosyltransferase / alpha-amylase